MLSVSSNCETSFLLDLIDLGQPLKLSKKQVNDETVFDMLISEKRADWQTILNKLISLPEFKKLKLAQRKKIIAVLEE